MLTGFVNASDLEDMDKPELYDLTKDILTECEEFTTCIYSLFKCYCIGEGELHENAPFIALKLSNRIAKDLDVCQNAIDELVIRQ